MKSSKIFVMHLLMSFLLIANMPYVFGGEYHQAEYQSYEPKQHEYHQEYHPPPPPAKKSGANVDINIPLDFGTIAKFGILGLTQLKLLFAMGKIAGAGLGVGALGLSQLGKLGLHLGPVAKGGGIAIDIGAGHHHHHPESKSHSHEHYSHSEKHY